MADRSQPLLQGAGRDKRFDGWQETITECIKEGFWQDKALTDGKYTGGYFWEVEDLDGRFYICLNVVRKEVA